MVTDLVLLHGSWWLTVPAACLGTAALVALARRTGLSWADLGLARAAVGRGLRWGLPVGVLVLAVFVAVAVVPLFAAALDDDRTPDSGAAVLLKVALIIPLRTVLLEEVAFRGVLWGAVNRRSGPRRATLVSSIGFGLWHVPQSFAIIDANGALGPAADRSPLLLAAVVLAVVIVTGLCGALFAELRRRSGSLVTPMCLHWVINGAGTVLSHLA